MQPISVAQSRHEQLLREMEQQKRAREEKAREAEQKKIELQQKLKKKLGVADVPGTRERWYIRLWPYVFRSNNYVHA